MEYSLIEYIIIILGSFIAGCINTLAGSGSAITLAILTEVMGLPGNVANGTNRIGVVAQGGLSSYVFHKNGKLDLKIGLPIIVFVTIGSLFGVYVATIISNDQFKEVFKYIMVLMLVVILVNPKRWLTQSEDPKPISLWIGIPLFLAVGFYGGFIQMGMGIFFLAVLVLASRFDIIQGNAIKAFTVTFYTVFVIIIFQLNGLIDWKAGLLLAVGQMVGGYVTAEFASNYKGADVWAYRILVLIVIVVILKLFGLFDLLNL